MFCVSWTKIFLAVEVGKNGIPHANLNKLLLVSLSSNFCRAFSGYSLMLSSYRNDFERGERSHFKVMLKQDDIVNIGLFWWPGFTLNEEWCADWVRYSHLPIELIVSPLFLV